MKICLERLLLQIVVQGKHHLAAGKNGIVMVTFFEIQRNQVADPTLTMDDIGRPTQFLDRLQHAAGKENRTLGVVGEGFSLGIGQRSLAVEVVLVGDEIHLHTGGGQRRYLDNQGPVHIADDEVHTRQADDFVQLMLALVDTSEAGHKRADFFLKFLYPLRQVSSDMRKRTLRKIGKYLRIDE